MSRIGNSPIEIPTGVQVSIADGLVSVKGPKGDLEERIDSVIEVKVEDNRIICTRTAEDKDTRSKHGLFRSLINNMVIGASVGYKKELELVGVGYRANVNGQRLELSLGMSHTTVIRLATEIKASAVTERGKNPIITLECSDKQLIGQVASKIRSLRKPEPYKGKGVRFVGEHIRRKAGKSAAK